MKKIMIPLVWIILASCSTGNSGKETGTDHQHETTSDEIAHPGRDSTTLKWKLDSSTRTNMAGIRNIVYQPFSEENVLNQAAELKRNLNKLVSECRMKGADHDALHAWLQGFMADVALLNDGKDTSEDWLKLQEDMRQFDKDFS